MNNFLNAEVKNNALHITIGLEALKASIEMGSLNVSMGGDVVITDMDEFKDSFVNELMREAEDGATPIHRMFDDVALTCIENGELGIDVNEDL